MGSLPGGGSCPDEGEDSGQDEQREAVQEKREGRKTATLTNQLVVVLGTPPTCK